MITLSKYSMGIGDRFGMEGTAQLRAFVVARDRDVDITPVWNKSNREHALIGTRPEDVRAEARQACQDCRWQAPYFVDADHVSLANVDKFLDASDFFTIDVADTIGKSADGASIDAYLFDMQRFVGALAVPGIDAPIEVTRGMLSDIAERYLAATQEAGRVYRHIATHKGPGTFVTEVSFDEASVAQTPAELFFILAALAREGVPAATVAPKFSGEFLKGIDYVGDLGRFAREFDDDLAVLALATRTFTLPASLKLSIHSGSDKFSLYPIIRRALARTGAGIHLKTAGTTWLEEVLGLVDVDGAGLAFAKSLYREAYARYDEMAKPYQTVIAIERAALPSPEQVDAWSRRAFVEALEHDRRRPGYNVHVRQLLHISFRIAAERGEVFRALLREHRRGIEGRVSANILNRHMAPLFLSAVD
jgi:hypothetical protein